MNKPLTILAIQPWYPANAPTFLIEAFERAGHKVFRCGPQYFDHMGLMWPESDCPKINLEIPRESDWNIDFFIDYAAQNECAPDIVVISEENYHNTIENTTKIPSILWSMDGWPENYARRSMVQPTMAYTNHPFGIRIHPQSSLPEGWHWLPGAAAPWIHRDLLEPRTVDFALFATTYGERQNLCNGLREHGFRVLNGKATTAAYVRFVNIAISTLHNPQPGEIQWRFFEHAAMGCINITWYTPLLDVLGYKKLQHYYPISVEENNDDPWPDLEDLASAVAALKYAHDIYQYIHREAKHWTLHNHTYFHRAATILRDIKMMPYAMQILEYVDNMKL